MSNNTPTEGGPTEPETPQVSSGADPITKRDTAAPASRTASEHPTKSSGGLKLDPGLDQHPRAGLSGGTWIALILGALILILLLIFIVQNNVPADFAYFGWAFSLPLGVAMLFAAIAGVLVTALLGSVRLFKLNHRIRRLEKERQSIRKAVG